MKAIAVDIDGTLVDITGLHDWARGDRTDYDLYHDLALKAPPIQEMIDIVQDVYQNGQFAIVLITVRSQRYTAQTLECLDRYEVPFHALYMSPEKDELGISDVERKSLLVDDAEADGYEFVMAYDDNPYMCDMFANRGILAVQVPGWVEAGAA